MEVNANNQTFYNPDRVLTEEDIKKLEFDRTEEVLKELIDIEGKTEVAASFSGKSYEIKELDGAFKFNSTKYDISKLEFIKENNNLPDEEFVFKSGDTVGQKHVKSLMEKFDEYPHMVIGQTQARYENTSLIIMGTGTLIGPNIVLTSASNVYRKNIGKYIIF